MSKRLFVTLAAILFIPLSGCATSQDDPTPAPSTTATAPDTAGGVQRSATRVRFSTADAEIIIPAADNPTSRDFVSKLPLTLTFEDFAGKEKISYLPERLTTDGSSGSAPGNSDLIYYKPWGNLGFYYNADGGHDDNVIPIGMVESGMEQLNRLERGQVTVEVID